MSPGPAAVYLAEDALPRVRDRVAHLCRHRGLSLGSLDLHVVTAPSLRLDRPDDQRALDQTLSDLRPRLLLLDPLVRLHRLDENSAADVSGLLGFLRELNRRHNLALIVVHHMAKRSRRDPGQALRGSSDLHAWTDSACYLVRRSDQRLRLTVEHRAAPAPDPLLLSLAHTDGEPLRLRIEGNDTAPPPLAEAVRQALQPRRAPSPGPLSASSSGSTTPASVTPYAPLNSVGSSAVPPTAGPCPHPPMTPSSTCHTDRENRSRTECQRFPVPRP
jgi:hypothetical protein